MQRHDELASLAAGYVLSALEPEEHAAFAAHLSACPQCSEQVAELRAVVDGLALTVDRQATPPEALKARLMAVVQADADRHPELSPPAKPPLGATAHRRWLSPRSLVAAIAALLIALAGVSAWAFALQDRLETNQARLSTLYEAMTVLAGADQRWGFEGTDIEPGARGLLAYSNAQRAAVLMVWELPPQMEGQTYNAWTLQDGVRQGVGRMHRTNGGLWVLIRQDLATAEGVGITLRDEGRAVDVTTIPLTPR